MRLQVLLVEDNEADLAAYIRDLPAVFQRVGLEVQLHPANTFEKATELISDQSRRFDLILSDTFKGEHSRGDAAVIAMIEQYRNGRFCPLVVFSASPQPPELKLGAFVLWADKAPAGGIEDAIVRMLRTGVPQEARRLHDQLDTLAASYLWGFLEDNWEAIEAGGHATAESLGRLIRRRAALQLAEIAATGGGQPQPVSEVHGLEFYVYPPINQAHYMLGQVVRHKERPDDVRVILTPHCYLVIQPGQTQPRAAYVRVVKTVSVRGVLGDKLDTARNGEAAQRDEQLRRWTTPPPDTGRPKGRYWYLPAFLEIPHLFCDFLQVDSLPYAELQQEFESLAVLTPPYAESLQACWTAFDSAVGIPNLVLSSIASMLEEPPPPAAAQPG